MKVLVMSLMALSMSSPGAAAVSQRDTDILTNALRCRANGISLKSCIGHDEDRIAKEVLRCDLMDVNLAYCLTTTLDEKIWKTIAQVAAEAKRGGIPVKRSLQLNKKTLRADKVGVLESLVRCDVHGLPLLECI